MSPAYLITQLGWALLHFVWQGALIGLLAAAGLWLLRRHSPRARYALACSALLACPGWPALTLLAQLAGRGGPLPSSTVVVSALGAMPLVAATPLAWLQDHLGMLVVGWLACSCALALRLLLGLLWIRRAARAPRIDGAWQARVAAMAASGGIGRAVTLRVVDELQSPLTAGWWRPVILLPAALLAGMPPDLLEALIAHELGHVKRCDYLVNLLQNVIETLLFYHPAVWWLSRRIRAERELIADDFAATQLGDARCLALALSELEKRQFSQHHLALAANQGELMSRIKRLLRPAAPSMQRPWQAALPVLGVAAALLAGCAQMSNTAAVPHTPVRTAAKASFASCAKPEWPTQSLRDGNTGTATLGFLIGPDGKVRDSTVKKSSGYAPLDEAARSGISKCTFIPATEDGKPVESWMQMTYMWTLE